MTDIDIGLIIAASIVVAGSAAFAALAVWLKPKPY